MSPSMHWDIFCQAIDNYGDVATAWRLAEQLATCFGDTVRLWVDRPDVLHALRRGGRPPPAMPPWAAPASGDAASHDTSLDAQMREAAHSLPSGLTLHYWEPADSHGAGAAQPPDAQNDALQAMQMPDWSGIVPAHWVIAAYSCALPAPYRAAMARRNPPSRWINLEYLSAEDWIEGCHLREGVLPDGLHQTFYFPGFTPTSGGLLRGVAPTNRLLEEVLPQQDSPPQKRTGTRDKVLEPSVHPALQALVRHRQTLRAAHRHVVNAPRSRLTAGGRAMEEDLGCASLFCYEHPLLPTLLELCAADEMPLLLAVTGGQSARQVASWLKADFQPGDLLRRGNLYLYSLPFLSQADYDRLLGLCDWNWVRGEDSLLRALWAGTPLFWQIYPQTAAAHLPKLDAFLGRYLADLPAEQQTLWKMMQRAWNGAMPDAVSDIPRACAALRQHWPAWRAQLPRWRVQAERFRTALLQQTDLATRLRHGCLIQDGGDCR